MTTSSDQGDATLDRFLRLPSYPESELCSDEELNVNTSYTTYVRALEDVETDDGDNSQATEDYFLSPIKAGEYIKVEKRLRGPYWLGRMGQKTGRIRLDERLEPFLTGKFRALWSRSSVQTEELNFEAEDTITILYRQSNWWYWGETKGRVGLVPFNFLESIPPVGRSDNTDPTGWSVEVLKLIEWQADDHVLLRARAIWAWQGNEFRDLTLKEGDIIDVFSRFHEHWWFGRSHDRVGIFPCTYVTTELDRLVNSSRKLSRPPWYPYYVMALFSMNPKDDIELRLTHGDIITVEYMCRDQWWKGWTMDGRSGWFPSTFVRPLLDRREPCGIDGTNDSGEE